MSEVKSTTLELDEIVRLPKLQGRAQGVNADRVDQMAMAIKADQTLPRVRVWEIEQEGHEHHGKCILTDGFTRCAAYAQAGRKIIPVSIHKGTWQQCVLDAAEANVEHDTGGLPRTSADKKRALMIFASAYEGVPKGEWPSNRDTARKVGVSHQFVNEVDPFGRGKHKGDEEDEGIKDRSHKTKAKANGKAPRILTFLTLENYIGYVIRGLEKLTELYDIDTASKAYKSVEDSLDHVLTQVHTWDKQFKAASKKAQKDSETDEKAKPPAPGGKSKKSQKKAERKVKAATAAKSNPNDDDDQIAVEPEGADKEYSLA